MAKKKKAPAKRAPKTKLTAEPSKKAGRPTLITAALIEEICMRIIEPRSLRSISGDLDMPNWRTVLGWLMIGNRPEPPALHAIFLQQYTQARQLQQEVNLDDCIDIADDGRNDWMMRKIGKDEFVPVVDNEAINRSRMRIDTRLKMAEKMLPKKYGTKIDLNHGGQVGNVLTAIVHKASATQLVPPGGPLVGSAFSPFSNGLSAPNPTFWTDDRKITSIDEATPSGIEVKGCGNGSDGPVRGRGYLLQGDQPERNRDADLVAPR